MTHPCCSKRTQLWAPLEEGWPAHPWHSFDLPWDSHWLVEKPSPGLTCFWIGVVLPSWSWYLYHLSLFKVSPSSCPRMVREDPIWCIATIPEFLIKLPPQLLVKHRDTISLFCIMKGIPTPFVIWLHNQLIVKESVFYSLKHDGPLCCLNVKNVGPWQGGTYTCKLVNSTGDAECSPVMTGWHLHALVLSAISANHVNLPLLSPTHTVFYHTDKETITIWLNNNEVRPGFQAQWRMSKTSVLISLSTFQITFQIKRTICVYVKTQACQCHLWAKMLIWIHNVSLGSNNFAPWMEGIISNVYVCFFTVTTTEEDDGTQDGVRGNISFSSIYILQCLN